MTRLQLWFSQRLYNLLGHFPEVRRLRTVQSRLELAQQEHGAAEFQWKREREAVATAQKHLSVTLEDTKRALVVMTDARLNADRAVEVIRGELDALREVTEREIAGLRGMVDWFGLELRGRQVFGLAPAIILPKDDQAAAPARALTGRQASRMLTERFLREVEEKGRQEPRSEPEYASTARFSENSAAKTEKTTDNGAR